MKTTKRAQETIGLLAVEVKLAGKSWPETLEKEAPETILLHTLGVQAVFLPCCVPEAPEPLQGLIPEVPEGPCAGGVLSALDGGAGEDGEEAQYSCKHDS